MKDSILLILLISVAVICLVDLFIIFELNDFKGRIDAIEEELGISEESNELTIERGKTNVVRKINLDAFEENKLLIHPIAVQVTGSSFYIDFGVSGEYKKVCVSYRELNATDPKQEVCLKRRGERTYGVKILNLKRKTVYEYKIVVEGFEDIITYDGTFSTEFEQGN